MEVGSLLIQRMNSFIQGLEILFLNTKVSKVHKDVLKHSAHMHITINCVQ